MQLDGKNYVAVFSDGEKEIGTAQVCHSGKEFLYGVVAFIGTRGDMKSFKDCVDKLEESIENHWCLIWLNADNIKERYAKVGIYIESIEHVDLFELTEKVMYENSVNQK